MMKIIRGPSEKELSEFTLMKFKSIERVKPQASRQSSDETYFLARGFD